jgi:hypothetical protein
MIPKSRAASEKGAQINGGTAGPGRRLHVFYYDVHSALVRQPVNLGRDVINDQTTG